MMARWRSIKDSAESSIDSALGVAAARALGLTALLYLVATALPAVSTAAVSANVGGSFSGISREPGMYGEPAVAARYWRQQSNSDCGEMAVADVVGEITGREPTEQEITTVAADTPSAAGLGPVWRPRGFTDIQDIPKLLAYFGIAADNIRTDIDGLKRMLGADKKVIAHVNAEILWDRPGKRDIGDHFVVVTGIDTRRGVVHLNDSAIATGRDETVSIAAFSQAWAPNGRAATATL